MKIFIHIYKFYDKYENDMNNNNNKRIKINHSDGKIESEKD